MLRYAAMFDAEVPIPGWLMAFPEQVFCAAVLYVHLMPLALCVLLTVQRAAAGATHKHLCATSWLTPLHCLLQVKPQEVELVRRDYVANGGWETFLSYEDPRQDILVGLLRLRQVGSSSSISAPQLNPATAAHVQSTTATPARQHKAPDPQYMLAR